MKRPFSALGEPVRSVVFRLRNAARQTRIFGAFDAQRLPAILWAASAGLKLASIHAIYGAATPSRIALVDDHQSLTYAQVDRRINQFAHLLQNAGVDGDSRVILMMENRAEYVIAWFALFRIGASSVHASYRSTASELEFLVDHANSTAVVGSSLTLGTIRAVGSTRQALRIIAVEDARESEVDASRLHAYPAVRPRSGFKRTGDNIVYTSGTTGTPKGAVRDFDSMGVVELSRILERLPMRVGDRHLVLCPMYHSGAQAFVLINSALGSTIYLQPHFDAEAALSCLTRHRIHSTFMVPTMVRRMLDLEGLRSMDMPDLRALVSGAAAFPHDLRMRAIAAFGDRVFDFYGATELGWVTLVDSQEMRTRPGSVGRALAGQTIHVADAERQPLPAKEVGTIFVENQQHMQGYLDDPSASSSIRSGHWTTVDDLGWLDDDGYLYLSGRDRDMIISGGVNIYPVEIEETLMRHRDVTEAAVIGLPDPDWGESVAAVVVGSKTLDTSELEAWARKSLSGHKIPRIWISADSLPRNATGKVLKRQLREAHA